MQLQLSRQASQASQATASGSVGPEEHVHCTQEQGYGTEEPEELGSTAELTESCRLWLWWLENDAFPVCFSGPKLLVRSTALHWGVCRKLTSAIIRRVCVFCFPLYPVLYHTQLCLPQEYTRGQRRRPRHWGLGKQSGRQTGLHILVVLHCCRLQQTL